MLSSRLLEVLQAVLAEEGSVSKAARRLNISQPTVSQMLSSIEEELGFALFNRIRGRLVPTVQAHTLEPQLQELLNSVTSFEEKALKLSANQDSR